MTKLERKSLARAYAHLNLIDAEDRQLCTIRQELLDRIYENGGHVEYNLSTIMLMITMKDVEMNFNCIDGGEETPFQYGGQKEDE